MSNNVPLKVIIDTNLWISFLIGKELATLKPLLVNKTMQPVLTDQLIKEIDLVTQRPKLQKYFAVNKVQELLKFLQLIGLFVEIKSEVTICRDSKDNFLLALAQDSQADYLITGDLDLLVIKQFGQTAIVTYQEFYSLIESNEKP
ncbi:putative toxin-antitoxin system toxin component, PIN family [Oscillatoriales cyanobacterium USR001]|nr:putative toxin-antitoxin system toxin component, PIN family [Oscillatoriales cyanobacterium USR001]